MQILGQSNRLKALQGRRAGQHGIRINGQRRICFVWDQGIARDISVPPRRINEIVHGKRAVTADTALRLSRYFGTSEGFWMGLQADYELEEARNRLGKRLQQEVRSRAA
jgi:addiction module HigA family antidote